MSFLTCFSMVLWTMSLFRLRRRRLRDFSCIPWFPPALERRTRPFPVTLNRFEAALFVFIFGMTGSRFRSEMAAARKARAVEGHRDAEGSGVMVAGGGFVKRGALPASQEGRVRRA